VLARLVLLFVFVPLVELALLVWIGERVGLLPTVALVVLTGITGAALARQQGLSTLRRFQASLAEGRPPHGELLEGLLILIAGAVLLTPGMLTDLVGFALLVPPLRRPLTVRLGRRFARRVVVASPQGAAAREAGAPRGDAVDVEYSVEEDPRSS
jgi:UPF0716 protein FxsA